MKTIKDVCSMYGVEPIERGFIVTAGGMVSASDISGHRYMVWTPTERNDTWTNLLFDNGNKIIERNNKPSENDNLLKQISEEKGLRRITFWRKNKTDDFKFIGVFVIDENLSSTLQVRLYTKISDILPALKSKKTYTT